MNSGVVLRALICGALLTLAAAPSAIAEGTFDIPAGATVMALSLLGGNSVDETDARRPVARVGPTSGQRRRPRRNFTILRHAIDSANSAEKALIHA